MLDSQQILTLRRLMEYEASRKAPPRGFPALPDLPGGRYTDPRFYVLEQQHIWAKSWLLAGHIDEVPVPGAFRLWETAGQPVVIVHAEDGTIGAFYNTCSHRGAPVVTELSGARPRLTCRYHGWSYGLKGNLIAIRDVEDYGDSLDFECRGLRSIRCERYGNLIFVNFDDGAPTLLDWLGPIADEWKEFQFDKCRLAARHIFDLNCNWALKAFGRRVGVLILGLVWAAWHLVPTFLKVGLFPELEAAPPLMLVAFVGACLIYRELLTRFVERSCSWLGAAAGHAAPNLMFTGFIAWGLVILERPEAWQWFPAPGGLVFPALALAAVLALRRRTSTVAA